MSVQTTRQESRISLLHAWLSSITFHGVVLLSLFPLFRDSLIPVHKESFHWDVTLVQSTRAADVSDQPVDTAEPTVASFPKHAFRPVRTTRPAAPSAERIVPSEPQAAEPVAAISQSRIASSAVSLKEPDTATTLDNAAPNQPQLSDPPRQQWGDQPANSITTETSIPQAAAVTSSDGAGRTMEPTQPPISPATASIMEAASTPRLDYGWLQQAIFRRLEELKRSSRPLLDQSQPFKVTVKAVVSNEGVLLDSSVVKSSGLDRIDQEAVALVQRAFPLQLDRSLDRQQIVMRIPITYSQE